MRVKHLPISDSMKDLNVSVQFSRSVVSDAL